MRTLIILTVLLLTAACTTVGPPTQPKEVNTMFTIKSPEFENGQDIPRKYTCQGEDINPPLFIEGIPQGTKSIALIVDDPDAPMGTWVHWLVMDISNTTRVIKQAAVPGTQVTNSFGRVEYGGPCPPSGKHRYFFKIYALDIEKLQAKNADEFYKGVANHKIAESQLMGLYQKG